MAVGLAVLAVVTTNVRQRHPRGYTQPLAYRPDIRRRVALMSAQLEAARWVLRDVVWIAASPAYLKAQYVSGKQ